MKTKIFFIAVILLSVTLTITAQKTRADVSLRPDSTVTDSTEYELIVFDQGFETWFLLQPSNQHSKEYYKSKNTLYADEWNRRYRMPLRYRDLYLAPVDYDPLTDYGYDIERKLYYYFRYFEKTNHVRLLPGAD